MPRCIKLKRKKTQVCIGDLDQVVAIQSRALSTGFNSGESATYTTVFSPWAMVETLKDIFIIDAVTGDEVEATHRFTIRFPDINVSGERWVLFDSKRYRIAGQTNLEERSEFLQLLCTQRGADDKEAANA